MSLLSAQRSRKYLHSSYQTPTEVEYPRGEERNSRHFPWLLTKISSAKPKTNEVDSSSDSKLDLDIYMPESESVNVSGQDEYDESLEVQEVRREGEAFKTTTWADNKASEHHDNGRFPGQFCEPFYTQKPQPRPEPSPSPGGSRLKARA